MVDALIERGYKVKILDSLTPQVHPSGKWPEYINRKAELIHGDVRDRDILKWAISDCDAVIHDAALVGVAQSMYQISDYTSVNVLGTATLLDVLVNESNKVKKVLVASSMSNYGEGLYHCKEHGLISPKLRTIDSMELGQWEHTCPHCGQALTPVGTLESKRLEPQSVYALSKRDQEEYGLNVAKAFSIPLVACRYFNVYGPRQSLNNPYTGVAAIFSSAIKSGNSPIVYEDGNQRRDFTSVHDIVRAKLLLLENDDANYQVFNVGTGISTSVNEVVETLKKLYGREDIESKVINRFRAGDIRHCYADISKLKTLGYSPSISFEDGMRELVEWGEQQESTDSSEQAHKELIERGLLAA
jgi:dTDP-L-rhamnose 4-epimerase